MTVKRFKIFLASSVDKEEQWLTDMSRQGFHFKKYGLFTYTFDENPNESYVYQIDFREANEEYMQLCKDAGWQYVDSALKQFHYFRTEANESGVKKIYSDGESVKETFQRMMKFYLILFIIFLTSQIGLFLTWKGQLTQIIMTVIIMLVILLYLYVFISLKRKIDFY
ncbi:DUF2812 domain-containing protein [Sporosarcina psychrophila]|uniref:DUF2812 domain-containing protein n=1 Tax=Sporosarcina psychrophila TaxID=1476 RepID=UPI0030CC5158